MPVLQIREGQEKDMERYVDGFLIPIAIDKVRKYKEIAQKAGEVWKEHGALSITNV
jgi:uncharacterized protein YbaA (DUF1428 family)